MRDLVIRWRASLRFMPSIKNQHGRGNGPNATRKKSKEGVDMESEPVMVPSGKYSYKVVYFGCGYFIDKLK